jgi:two-component system, sensor histidine kinase and response regulator
MNRQQTNTTKGSILIVDDTPNNLRLLASMLTQQGYKVHSAISGTVALTAVKAVHPDLIVLDINMPEMDGYEVCDRLKAEEVTRKIPVLFLSAFDDVSSKVKAFQAGGVDYITKPFQVEEVLARVESQLTLQRMQTELQQAKTDALRALAQEQELNRLRSEFISMISHDFRTPLTSIQGFAELLRYGNANLTNETRDRYFNKIDAAIEHLLHLLDEVLLIGGIESGRVQYQPVAINLEQFCRDLIETVQFSAHNQHQIALNYRNDGVGVEMDQMLLQQILVNLLSNAVKYSPHGGQIQLEVECQAEVAIFRVRDQGIGIPPENQPHLFESFYRGSNVQQIQGTGLGLAIVQRCVTAHHGNIQIESAENQGTTVTVTLPIAPPQNNLS